jgi:hypothetical protein
MKKFLIVFLLAAVFFLSSNVMAADITIFDNRNDASTNSWYQTTAENQEVEPGMIYNQSWDLEAFLLNGTTLSMVGGYDFVKGYSGTASGDIFLDVTGDAKYGVSADSLRNGYDYVFDVDWSGSTWSMYKLTSDDGLSNVLSYNIPYSNPWQFSPSGQNQTMISTGTWSSLPSYIDAEGIHYTVTGFDMIGLNSIIGTDYTFISHFTMTCGNDNLMGQGTTSPVPEPATMLLFGTGLVGLAGFNRKKFLKS